MSGICDVTGSVFFKRRFRLFLGQCAALQDFTGNRNDEIVYVEIRTIFGTVCSVAKILRATVRFCKWRFILFLGQCTVHCGVSKGFNGQRWDFLHSEYTRVYIYVGRCLPVNILSRSINHAQFSANFGHLFNLFYVFEIDGTYSELPIVLTTIVGFSLEK